MSLALMTNAAALQIGTVLWQVFYFLFMFGLVVLLSVAATRLWVKKASPRASGRNMQMLEFMPLGTNKGLYLVRVPDAVWLLGMTEQGISILNEYPPTIELQEIAPAAGVMPVWLNRIWPPKNRVDAAKETAEPVSSTGGFTKELLERLQQLKEPKE